MKKIEKETVIIVCVTFVLTVAATLLFMRFFNVGIGDKVFVSLTEYENARKIAMKYGDLEELYTFLEGHYYQKLDDDQLMTGIYKGLFEGTEDGYTRFMTEEEYKMLTESIEGEFEGIGVVMGIGEDGYIEFVSVMEDSPAQRAGVMDGDILMAVDDVTYVGSEMSEAAKHLKGESGTKVKVTVSRKGEPKEFVIERGPISEVSVYSKILDGNIGYIKVTGFINNTAELFQQELTAMEELHVDGLVIDLRSNGGGLVNQSEKIADMLMDEGTIVYMEDGHGERTYLTAKEGRTELDYVVLINGGSASASEILVAGIQGNHEGVIVGTQSYGKGITQQTWPLTNGSGIEITVSQYFAPDGSVIHKKGITPDVVVEFEESDIEDGVVVNDRQLNAAVEQLTSAGKNE